VVQLNRSRLAVDGNLNCYLPQSDVSTCLRAIVRSPRVAIIQSQVCIVVGNVDVVVRFGLEDCFRDFTGYLQEAISTWKRLACSIGIGRIPQACDESQWN